MIITFLGQNLRNEIFIYKVRIKVEPYMTLSIIYNCFKFGHPSAICKGETLNAACVVRASMRKNI